MNAYKDMSKTTEKVIDTFPIDSTVDEFATDWAHIAIVALRDSPANDSNGERDGIWLSHRL